VDFEASADTKVLISHMKERTERKEEKKQRKKEMKKSGKQQRMK
jgi:hypothetical protein